MKYNHRISDCFLLLQFFKVDYDASCAPSPFFHSSFFFIYDIPLSLAFFKLRVFIGPQVTHCYMKLSLSMPNKHPYVNINTAPCSSPPFFGALL